MTSPISSQDIAANSLSQQIKIQADINQEKTAKEDLDAENLHATVIADANKAQGLADPTLVNAATTNTVNHDKVHKRRHKPGENFIQQQILQEEVNAQVQKASTTTTSSSRSKGA